MDFIGYSATGTIADEQALSNVGGSAFNLEHDLFYGATITTGTGGTGTTLILNTDYTFTEATSPAGVQAATLSGLTVYDQVTVTNGTYQTGALYIVTNVCSDIVETDDINIATKGTALVTGESIPVSTTSTISINSDYLIHRVNCAMSGGSLTVTLPNGTQTGERCFVKHDGGGANILYVKGTGVPFTTGGTENLGTPTFGGKTLIFEWDGAAWNLINYGNIRTGRINTGNLNGWVQYASTSGQALYYELIGNKITVYIWEWDGSSATSNILMQLPADYAPQTATGFLAYDGSSNPPVVSGSQVTASGGVSVDRSGASVVRMRGTISFTPAILK